MLSCILSQFQRSTTVFKNSPFFFITAALESIDLLKNSYLSLSLSLAFIFVFVFLLDRPCFPITLTAKNRRQNIWCYMPPRQRLSCRVPFLAWNETGVKKEIWEVSSFQAGCCSVRPPPPPPTNQMKPLSSHAAPPNTPLSSLQARCFKSLSQPLLLMQQGGCVRCY